MTTFIDSNFKILLMVTTLVKAERWGEQGMEGGGQVKCCLALNVTGGPGGAPGAAYPLGFAP